MDKVHVTVGHLVDWVGPPLPRVISTIWTIYNVLIESKQLGLRSLTVALGRPRGKHTRAQRALFLARLRCPLSFPLADNDAQK